MSGKLSTHVLDTVIGKPAPGMKVDLYSLDLEILIKTFVTNNDGRSDGPVLFEYEMQPGTYELAFHVGDYFGQKRFLDVVPIRFIIDDPAASYHVPLLCSPWAYSTYRGS